MCSYRLGIDLGSTSLGWCALKLNNGAPVGILDMGVRIFDDGRDDQSKTPLAVERRDKRSQRRRRDRLLRRKRKLMEALVKCGLMPAMEVERKNLETLDPYYLRVQALDQPMQSFEIGRAIFHLGQRRGFKSNRKDIEKSKENGVMKEAISRTIAALQQKQARTLGEYLVLHAKESAAGLKNPMRFKSSAIGTKVAWDIYPSRQMVEEEFNAIWENQKPFCPLLTDAAYHEIHYAIFHQEKLQIPERGKCWLTGEVRAYKALSSFQIFRALQDLNHLEIRKAYASEVGLTEEQRQKIKEMLLQGKITAKGELSFDKIRKALKLSGAVTFNLESPSRGEIKGDLTGRLLADEKGFGELWWQMSLLERDAIVEKLLNLDDEESENLLSKWLGEKYDISLAQVEYIIDQSGKLESGTCSLSQTALYAIIPYLETGLTFDKACTLAFGAHTQVQHDGTEPNLPYYGKVLHDSVLPAPKAQSPDERAYGRINNPTVHIGLNQLRKLVNRLIEIYGKPAEIHIELARDLPLSAVEKNKLLKGQENNKKENDRIDEDLKKAGCTPSQELRLRYRLWEELEPLGKSCPFSGKAISLSDALSDKTEIEHIIPFSISYDDGRSNKVLCLREANRLKGNNTPYEAFGQSDSWPEIYARAAMLPAQKSWRFEPDALEHFKDEQGDMIARQLHDTQYLSRIAKRYLSAICPDNKIVSTRGRITATMRRAWGLNLNYLLHESSKNIKSRDDHRHHAIDAFVTACVSRALLKSLSDQAKRSNMQMQRLSEIVPPPFVDWEKNKKDLASFLRKLIVSHKPDHGNADLAVSNNSTTGMLHKDTAYGIVSHDIEKDAYTLVTSIKIENLKLPKPNKEKKSKKTTVQPKTKYSFDEIRDTNIRHQIETIAEMSSDDKDFKQKIKNYAEKENIKTLRVTENVDGSKIVIVKDKLGRPYKAYRKGSNYCGDVIEILHGKDKGKWLLHVTPTFDAHQPGFVPLWRKEYPTAKLKWRLFVNDMVAFERSGQQEIARIQLWSQDLNYLFYVPHNISKMEKRIQINPKEFQKCHGRKISVDILGHVRDPLMMIQSHATNR